MVLSSRIPPLHYTAEVISVHPVPSPMQTPIWQGTALHQHLSRCAEEVRALNDWLRWLLQGLWTRTAIISPCTCSLSLAIWLLLCCASALSGSRIFAMFISEVTHIFTSSNMFSFRVYFSLVSFSRSFSALGKPKFCYQGISSWSARLLPSFIGLCHNSINIVKEVRFHLWPLLLT